MAAKHLMCRVTSCLSSEIPTPVKSLKQFYHIQHFVSISRPVSTACSVGIQEYSNRLIINWKEKFTDEYPLVWLRDNCQCPACFDQSSKSRTINFSNFQVNQKCKHVVCLK